jgi:hypothetical protein
LPGCEFEAGWGCAEDLRTSLSSDTTCEQASNLVAPEFDRSRRADRRRRMQRGSSNRAYLESRRFAFGPNQPVSNAPHPGRSIQISRDRETDIASDHALSSDCANIGNS